jgi:hypothetical protein
MGMTPLYGGNLVPFNTRMPGEMKDLIDALVTVQKLKGQRELLERALEAYREKCPEDFKTAEGLMKFLAESRPAAPVADK